MRTVLFCLLIPLLSAGQQVAFVKKTPLIADAFVGIDTYKNTYYIKENVFYKKTKKENINFADYSLGKITQADIINPLKILLFYQDTNTVVFLDNTLNEIERININTLPQNIFAQRVTNAGNNQLWIFDQNAQQLLLFNYRNHTIVFQSPYFDSNLIYQTSNFNYCYLLFENKIIVLNTYLSKLGEIPAQSFKKIAFYKTNSIGLDNTNRLFFLSPSGNTPIQLPVSGIQIKDLQLTGELLYIYDGKNSYEFSLKQQD